MRFFIGSPYPIYREVEQPRAGLTQRQGYLSLARFGTIQFRQIKKAGGTSIFNECGFETVQGSLHSIHPDVPAVTVLFVI